MIRKIIEIVFLTFDVSTFRRFDVSTEMSRVELTTGWWSGGSYPIEKTGAMQERKIDRRDGGLRCI